MEKGAPKIQATVVGQETTLLLHMESSICLLQPAVHSGTIRTVNISQIGVTGDTLPLIGAENRVSFETKGIYSSILCVFTAHGGRPHPRFGFLKNGRHSIGRGAAGTENKKCFRDETCARERERWEI
jgi:hypothetical protein